jgi:hypothetical protein
LLHICNYLPFEEDLQTIYLNNLDSLYPRMIYTSLIEIGLLVLEKVLFFNINTCKYGFPYCGPSRHPWTMMWKILYLHYMYIRKLSCKYDLFWLSGSVEKKKEIINFKWPHPIFAFLWLSPRWRGPGPLFQQLRIPFTQGWFIPSLIEIGLLVLEKIFFSILTHVNMVIPIVASSDPRGPWYEQFWIYTISESFHTNMTYSGYWFWSLFY